MTTKRQQTVIRLSELIPTLSKNSETTNLPSTLPPRLLVLKNKWGDAEQFLVRFNPARQSEMALPDVRLKCFSRSMPSMIEVNRLYGASITETWLQIQIKDLAEFSGVKEKISIQQLESLSKSIVCEYYFLTISELMLFFHLFKSGRYGKFYGAVDALVITAALRNFLVYRHEQLVRIRQLDKQKKEAEKQAEREVQKSRGELLTYDEWQELKWLFNM